MDNLNYIFGRPKHVHGIGNVHPIKLNDYDEFIDCSMVLYYSKNNFPEEFQEHNLLDLLVGLKDEKIIEDLEKVLTMVLKQDVRFSVINNNDYGFVIDETHNINRNNYDTVRQVIMQQNLMFEQKVYKDKLVQEWANKVIQARAKSSIKMEFEDMVSTVSVFTGKHYWDLAEYTIYQLKSDFNRISKFKDYDASVLFRTASSDVKINHFAEDIDLFKNPYDDLFKSKDKLKKLDDSIK
jgi:hypothetical protein